MTQSVSYDPSKFAERDVEHEYKYTVDVISLWSEIANIISMKHTTFATIRYVKVAYRWHIIQHLLIALK